MRLDVQPEPDPAERAALELALAGPHDDGDARSPWWREGLRELLAANEPAR